jgi:hypothetical protein
MKGVSILGNDHKISIEQTGKPQASDRRGRIVVQNYYYAQPGRADEVFHWRLHASDVREQLGFPRGRVLRRRGGTAEMNASHELPDVIWECEYPSLDARERDTQAVTATAEFQAVQQYMRTLIRRFERGTYEVEELPK